MSASTVLVVLFAALLHASWNALVKAGPNKLFGTVLVTTGAGMIALLLLPFASLPAVASWPWLAASVCCQVVYYLLLAAAYHHGDMGHAYPLMRGAAPLLVTIASIPLLGETLSAQQYVAIALICAGVFAMSLHSKAHDGAGARRATAFALLNAAVIACYTVIDGIGVRLSGAPAAYTMWLFLLTAIGLLLAVVGRRHQLLQYGRLHWRMGLLGGVGTMASYGLALWAMTSAPVAVVAALRETSILFASLIAFIFLRERVGARRVLAVGLIACGAAAMRFA